MTSDRNRERSAGSPPVPRDRDTHQCFRPGDTWEAPMRRWLAGVLGVVLLSGCAAGLPDGVDGDLTGGWALPPQAVQWRPLPSQCFDELVDTVGPGTYAPLNCAQGHLAETYWIGDLNGP